MARLLHQLTFYQDKHMKNYLLSVLLLCSAHVYSKTLEVTIEGVSPYKIDSLYELYEESPDCILTDHVLKNRIYYQEMMRSYLKNLDQEIQQVENTIIKKSSKAAATAVGSIGLFCMGRFMLMKGHQLATLEKPTNQDELNAFFLFLGSVPTSCMSIPAAVFGIKYTYEAVTYKDQLMERYSKGHKILLLLQDTN